MKKLWKTLFVVWITTLPLDGFSASEVLGTKCGLYEIYGVVRSKEGSPVLRIFEKSISESEFKLDKALQLSLSAYVDQSIAVKARLTQPLKNQRGVLGTAAKGKAAPGMPFPLDEITKRVPDPLNPMKDSKMVLLKELPCTKKD